MHQCPQHSSVKKCEELQDDSTYLPHGIHNNNSAFARCWEVVSVFAHEDRVDDLLFLEGKHWRFTGGSAGLEEED